MKTTKEKLILDLFKAYFDARKNKRNKIDSLKFEKNFEENIFKLADDIWERKYKPSRGICFISDYPVKREIFASNFRDRVVHHILYNYLMPIYEKDFIYDSYSCRIGKGTHMGINRVKKFMRACSNNYTEDCFILKLDISGYFMSLNKNILFAQVKNRIKNEKSLDYDLTEYLLEKVIYCDIENNCCIKGNRSDWRGLPRNKSLFYTKENCGLPIGNITSQLFGNVYMDSVDHFIKKDLKIKYYGRYVDDMVLVHKNKDHLKKCVKEIDSFLQKNLELSLHKNKTKIMHYKQGISFLGAYVLPHRIYAGKRTMGQIWKYININMEKEGLNPNKFYSYIGLTRHYSSYKSIMKMSRNNRQVAQMIKTFYSTHGK